MYVSCVQFGRLYMCIYTSAYMRICVLDRLSWDCGGGGASFSFYVCVLSIARATAARVGSTGL